MVEPSMGRLVHGGHRVGNTPIWASSLSRTNTFHSIIPVSGFTGVPVQDLHHSDRCSAPKLVLWECKGRFKL